MASPSLSTWFLSLKLLLLSTAIFFFALILRFSLPLISNFIFSDVPTIWTFLLSLLHPPYLYILLNLIILSILLSSKFLNTHNLDNPHSDPTAVVLPSDPTLTSSSNAYKSADVAVPEADFISSGHAVRNGDYVLFNGNGYKSADVAVPEAGYISSGHGVRNCEYVSFNGEGYKSGADVAVTEDDFIGSGHGVRNDDECVLFNFESVKSYGDVNNEVEREKEMSCVKVRRLESKEALGLSFSGEERSPVSARFGHRKAAKATSQGGKVALGVAKPKRQETLESTWRTMTEGRPMPLTRHLKKSDTMDSHQRRHLTPLRDQNGAGNNNNNTNTTPLNSKVMKKCETFSEQSRACKENHSSASSSPGSAKMRKEASLSQDELNRRVEAFIRKFNQEMRLQRQESLRQYREMTNSGGAR